MNVWEMNPYIRYMDQRKCSASYMETVFAYDYRLFAVLHGLCEIEISEQRIKLYQDSIVIIPPDVGYRLFFDVQRPALLYDVNFTMNYLPGKPMPPDKEENFCAETMPETPDSEIFYSFAILHDAQSVRQQIGAILKAYEEEETYYEERCSALLKSVLIDCLRSAPRETDENDLAVKVARFLEAHCRESLDGRGIGAAFGYHSFYLNRIFRERFGTTMHKFQTECRIRRACSMLVNTRLTIKEIADSLGFSPGPYFSEVFRSIMGMTPTQYRKHSAHGSSKMTEL